MLKKFIPVPFITIITLSLFSSCEKNDVTQPSFPNQANVSTNRTVDEIGNPENTQDYIGKIFYDGLVDNLNHKEEINDPSIYYTNQLLTESSPTNDIEQKKSIRFQNYLKENLSLSQVSRDQVNSQLELEGTNNTAEYLQLKVESGELSQQTVDFITTLNEIDENYGRTSEYTNIIKSLESEIMIASDINDDERNDLLKATSIRRYCQYYNFNVDPSGTSYKTINWGHAAGCGAGVALVVLGGWGANFPAFVFGVEAIVDHCGGVYAY